MKGNKGSYFRRREIELGKGDGPHANELPREIAGTRGYLVAACSSSFRPRKRVRWRRYLVA